MRGGDDGRDVRRTRGLCLSLKEVVTDGAAYDTPPVLLHEDLPGVMGEGSGGGEGGGVRGGRGEGHKIHRH